MDFVPLPPMKLSDKILSQTVVQLCLDKGIDHIVISPGSRNAPLTIGFGNNPNFKCFSVVDERCAAFFALGMAQQLRKPVAVVCTSGSALLNYYPAIAEAFYSDIPLIVISADRPAKYIDIGDGQTIRQENVFKNHVLYNANCSEGQAFQLQNDTEINIALNTAIEVSGPVHINLPFSEPLYRTVEEPMVVPQNVPVRSPVAFSDEKLSHFIDHWNECTKKMVLVGTLPPNSVDERFLAQWAQDPSVLVLTETTSNLYNSQFIQAIDQLISPLETDQFEQLRPEILLTFGGMVISKKIKSFLRSFPPDFHFHVDPKTAYNTYFALNHHFKTDINTFFGALFPKTLKVKSPYQQHWLDVKSYRLKRHRIYEHRIPYSDFLVFSKIFHHLPQNIQLQLSNSATVRYAQLFHISPSVAVFCNRGTSGIDGSTSTAVGAAFISKVPTVLLTGDLSFFYDSNGLWNDHIPPNFKIIVINNQGGGIFRILPGEKDTELFSTFFETTHSLNARSLAEMYGFTYESIDGEDVLEEKIKLFFQRDEERSLLEIFTPRTVNDEVLLEYFKFIS